MGAGDDIGAGDVLNVHVLDRADLRARLAGAQSSCQQHEDRVGGFLDGDVFVVHVLDDRAVVAGDSDAGLHRLADVDVPDPDVVKIARGFRAELQAIAAGFEVVVPGVDVFGGDL